MQFSARQLTGACRPLCFGQQSYRLPDCVSALRALTFPPCSSPQTSSYSAASLNSACTDSTSDRPDLPNEAVAEDEVTARPKAVKRTGRSALSDPVLNRDSKSTAKGARPSSISTHVLDDSQHLVKASSLPDYAWPLLTKLHFAGHDVFVVGGTVRDLLLGQEPKDLDLLTSASLQQVRGVANQCRIVGHRHPIALVHAAHKKVIEVSTFQPSRSTPSDVANLARQGRQGNLGPDLLDKSWGALWHANMRQRDFTVNAIMYDPFSHLLFDYMGGVADCTRRRLQCCKDPNESFQEDPHRMLRAVRLAGRCDLRISVEVEAAMRTHAPRLTSVSGSRLFGEAINIFCHGAALKSMQLLWRLHLLDVLMPPYAEYARLHKVSRMKPLSTDMTTWPLLYRLLHSLDKHASVDRPEAMTLVSAVLTAPLVVDAIAAHRAELDNIISKSSAKLSMKTVQRLLADSGNQSNSQTVSATIVQDAVLRWQHRLHLSSKANTAVQQRILMSCIIDAASETVKVLLPEGLLPRATVSAVHQMLLSFYGNLSQQTQRILRAGGCC
ncbi:hypothetical protein ABBQ32_003567 [Trebouxia sp. C0010 RCD-2024]